MANPIAREDVQRLLAEERAQLVEVLPPGDYEDEHLPAAINIPLGTLGPETARRLDPERPVIVWDTCFVVNERRVVLGRLGRSALARAGAASVREAMSPGPSTVRPGFALDEALERMRKIEIGELEQAAAQA